MSTTHDYLQKAEAHAAASGYIGLFLTLTVPSTLNKASPKEAYDWLQKRWKRARADMVASGCSGAYGMCFVEPKPNGMPLWHVVMWHDATDAQVIHDSLNRHWAQNKGDAERGQFKTNQLKKNLVVKYTAAKAMENTASLDAWASTWGIRRNRTFGDANLTTQGAHQ